PVASQTRQLVGVDRQRPPRERRALAEFDRLHRERLKPELHRRLSSLRFWIRRLSSLAAGSSRCAMAATRSAVKRCTGPAIPRLATGTPSGPRMGTATPTAPG